MLSYLKACTVYYYDTLENMAMNTYRKTGTFYRVMMWGQHQKKTASSEFLFFLSVNILLSLFLKYI